jgi:hypothetical protein
VARSKMNSAQTRRVIAAGMVGNVLEWYDFAIYGYFAAPIGRHFFPHEDPGTDQLYNLRSHIDIVRRKITSRANASGPMAAE